MSFFPSEFDKAHYELWKASCRLPEVNWHSLNSFNEPDKVVAILKPCELFPPAYALGQFADDGTFRQYSGSFPSMNYGRLMWVMHDSNHWYRVNLRLFVWKKLVVGELNVVLDSTRPVIGNIDHPCVGIVPPESTRVIVK